MIGLLNSHNFPTIPSGLIIPWASDSVTPPTGWSFFSAPNTGVSGVSGCYVIGAGASYSADSSGIGGSPAGKVVFDTTADGMHIGQSFNLYTGSSIGTGRYGYGGSDEGNHLHRIEVTPTIGYNQFQLIKASSNQEKLPAYSVLLNTLHNNIPWLDNVYTDNKLLRAGNKIYNSITSSSQRMLVTFVDPLPITISNGYHDHDYIGWANAPTSGGTWNLRIRQASPSAYDGFAGIHYHNFSSVIIIENIRKVYVTVWGKNIDFSGFKGMIGMWDSAAPIPNSWQICNGTNGTIDMRDSFIMMSTIDNKGIITGNNTISVSPDAGSNMLSNHDFDYHDHFEEYDCDPSTSVLRSAVHPNWPPNNWPHHHAGTQALNVSFKPQWYGLYFIQKM